MNLKNNDTTNAARGEKRVCCAILMILALLGAPGCSTATAAGCGVGVLTGVALAGVAAASTPKNSSVDAGAAIIGGSLFGVVSGCSAAATAEAVASSQRKKRRAASESQFDATTDPAPKWTE
jgi:hypothetical protein